MKKLRKILSTIIYTIVILIVICNCYMLIQKIINSEKTPSLLGYKAFVVSTGSMENTLNIGDIVIIKETSKENISENDIITFKENDYTITHRVIEIITENNETFYKTKGDNNNKADEELVSYENIEGVYQVKIPKIGFLIMNAKNKFVIFGILTVLFIWYIMTDIKESKKAFRHKLRIEYEEKDKNEKDSEK